MNIRIKIIGLLIVLFLFFGGSLLLLIPGDYYYLAKVHLLLSLVLAIYFFIKGGFGLLKTATGNSKAKFLFSSFMYMFCFFAVLGAVNYYFVKFDPIYIDTTEQKIHTLSKETQELLQGLKQIVTVRAFYIGGAVPEKVSNLLNRLEKHSDKISWVIVDPEKHPELTTKYGINEQETLSFSIDSNAPDEQSGKQVGKQVKIVRNISEEQVAVALQKLSSSIGKNVYFFTGYGDQVKDLEDDKQLGYLFLKEAIEGENVVIKKLLLQEGESIPSDASALIVLASKKEFFDFEKKAVVDYLNSKKSVLFLSEPNTTQDIAKLVETYGIKVGNDVVLDKVVKLGHDTSVGVKPMVLNYGNHSAIGDFSEGTIFITTNSVIADKDFNNSSVANGKVTEIAFTSAESWAEKDLKLLFGDDPQAALDKDDIQGPVSIAATYEDESSKQRIAVIGDTDFVNNVNIRQLYNRDLFLNILNWALDNEERITIRAKTMRESQKQITPEQFRKMFIFSSIIFPEILLLIGIFVWWKRLN